MEPAWGRRTSAIKSNMTGARTAPNCALCNTLGRRLGSKPSLPEVSHTSAVTLPLCLRMFFPPCRFMLTPLALGKRHMPRHIVDVKNVWCVGTHGADISESTKFCRWLL